LSSSPAFKRGGGEKRGKKEKEGRSKGGKGGCTIVRSVLTWRTVLFLNVDNNVKGKREEKERGKREEGGRRVMVMYTLR